MTKGHEIRERACGFHALAASSEGGYVVGAVVIILPVR
jgi:hypothetical protein